MKIEAEFAFRIFKRLVVDANGCWIWQGASHPFGYGQIRYKGVLHNVHRLMFIWFVRDLVGDEQSCHKCNVPACCNPDHLYPGTQTENMGQAAREGRFPKGFAHHNSKLNLEQVEQVIALHAEGRSASSLGRQFGVNHHTIGRIIQGKTYRRPPVYSRYQQTDSPEGID